MELLCAVYRRKIYGNIINQERERERERDSFLDQIKEFFFLIALYTYRSIFLNLFSLYNYYFLNVFIT